MQTNQNPTDPTYLRTIHDGLLSGAVHKDNASALPMGLVGMYEEALPPAANVNERKKFLEFFSIWALLKKEVSAEFVLPLLEGWTEDKVIEYISQYSKWFNSPVSGKYVLYHERLRTFILQKVSAHQFEKCNEQIIHQCQFALQAKDVDEWERYALEYLSTHLLIQAMESRDNQALKSLSYNTTHWNRQIEISKGFEWSKRMLNDMMLWAAKYNDDEVIECALNKVDLHHLEQNDAPRIVELVAQNDIETALQRIDSFGGNDKRSLRKKIVLYLLSLFRILDEMDCGKTVQESQLVFLRRFLSQMDSENKLVFAIRGFLPDEICGVIFNKWELPDYIKSVLFFINGLRSSKSNLQLKIESKGYLSPLYFSKQYVINLEIDDCLTRQLMNDIERGDYDLVLEKIKLNEKLDLRICLFLLLDVSRMQASLFDFAKANRAMSLALELIDTLFEPERSWALLDLMEVMFINKYVHGAEEIELEILLSQFNCGDEFKDLIFFRFFSVSLDFGLWESFLSVLNIYIKINESERLKIIDLPDVYMHLDFKTYFGLVEEFKDNLQKSIEINKAVKYYSLLNETQRAQELSKKIVYDAYIVESNAHIIVSMLNQGFFDDSYKLAKESILVMNDIDDDGFQELAISAFFKKIHNLFSIEKLFLLIDLLEQPYNRVRAHLSISNSLLYSDPISSKY